MYVTSDYISLVMSFPNLSVMTALCLFCLTLMRIGPIVSFLPFLGAKLPGGVKIGTAVALSAVFLPHVIVTHTHPLELNIELAGYMVKELFIGIILALMAAIPFYIAEASGVLIDFMRGSSSLQVTDPTMQTQVSSVGLLYNYVLIVLFFQIDGPFIFFDSIFQSYTLFPADATINPALFSSFKLPFWQMLAGLLTKITAISIQLAAPSLVAILMAEMFLGIANRLAPQVQIAFLGMSIKSLLGIALLYAGWFFILQQMARQSLIWLKDLNRLIQLMHF